MFNSKFLLISIASVLLAACGGGGGSDGETPANVGDTNTTTRINSFAVGGSSSTTSPVSLNPGINSGNFIVSWNISSGATYHVDLFVSEDAMLSDTDLEFFSKNCGVATSDCTSSTAQYQCQFNSQNRIACRDNSGANPGRDLTAFLDEIPKDAFLILEACDSTFESCASSAVRVRFQ